MTELEGAPGGRLRHLPYERMPLARCPVCTVVTELAPGGHPRLCRRCTEAEIGETSHDLGLRIERGQSLATFRRNRDREYARDRRDEGFQHLKDRF